MLLFLYALWLQFVAGSFFTWTPFFLFSVSAASSPLSPYSFTNQDMSDQVILTEEVTHDGQPVTIKVTTKELIVVPNLRKTTKAGYLSFDDVYGAVSGADRRGRPIVEVHALLHKGKKRADRIVPIQCKTEEQAQLIVASIRAVLAGVEPGAELPRRHIFVLVNPFGGTKKAPKIYENTVKVMFERAALTHEVVRTTHQGHAAELMKELDLSKYDAVVCISGDGLLNEVVNGVMAREDRDSARSIPLGLVPAGSGNGLCRCIATNSPQEAVHNIIKGHHDRMDLVRIEQEGAAAPLYSFLQVGLGLLADVDIESERFRWAGASRFTLSGIHRIFALRRYQAKISFLPAHGHDGNEDSEGPDMSAFPDDPKAAGWKIFDGRFVNVIACNVGWASDEFLVAPYASLHDGAFDIVILDGGVTSTNLLSWFLTPEAAKHVGASTVKYVKAKAMQFESEGPRGVLNVDGEVIENKKTHLSVVPSAVRLLVPRDLHQAEWDSSGLPATGLNVDDL